jgi:hypothetical protein
VDSEKQMCTWVHMAKTLQWEYDGEIPNYNVNKYIWILSNALIYIEIYYTYIKTHHKYTISTFKYIQKYSNIFKCTLNTSKYTINILYVYLKYIHINYKYIQIYSNILKYFQIH